MASRSEWRILVLWAIALVVTALIADNGNIFMMGGIFFICIVGSLLAIRKAATVHVEAIIVVMWLIALAALLASIDEAKANYLAPVYFVCMLGSVFTTRKAYQLPE